MSEQSNPQVPGDADAVLSLQETPAEENDVQAHAMAISTLSGSIIGSCE